jgi:hypothetical protein
VVVLLPMFDGEKTRRCRCGAIGLRSPIPERSLFYQREALCRTCCYEKVTARRQRLRDDPRARREAEVEQRRREDARIDRLLEAERAGVPLKLAVTPSLQEARTGPLLPISPFRGWLEGLVRGEWAVLAGEPFAETRATGRVADRLGVSPRTLYRYRFELDEVYEGMVDHACSRHGGVHILDLYPGLYDEVEAA